MSSAGQTYRQWILRQNVMGAMPQRVDDNHMRVELPTSTAEIAFYPYGDDEIVELRVMRASDGDSTFFLHFALGDDLAHARRLFAQMAEALEEESAQEPVHVLLSCTSALTTSLFAAKMNDVAQALGLGYDFAALSLDRALVTREHYAAIMLAPQAAYARQKMAKAHPDALVFEVPGKVFGSYDAPGAIRLLMHAFRELYVPGVDDVPLEAVRDLSDDRQVLAITLFTLNGDARLGYRLYDRGKATTEGAVRKAKLNYDDVGTLIEMLSVDAVDLTTLDAIAIAVPGVAYRGIIDLPVLGINSYDLGQSLTKRFGVPTYVDNNCNAAAVGCYVSQSEVENLVFYRHAFGHSSGGMGTVIDGRILKGRHNLAGEPHYMEPFLAYDRPLDEVAWTADGLHRIALCTSVSAISLISPDALYLAVDTVDDAEEFASELAVYMGEEYVPSIHIVSDYVERVYLGSLAMALQKLRDPHYRSRGVSGL